MRLIVLYGSRACEHDVSIITAVQAMDNADPSKYTVIPVYIDMAGRWWTGDALRRMDFYTHFDERRVDGVGQTLTVARLGDANGRT